MMTCGEVRKMTDQSGPQQRVRITFAKQGPLKYISHLDLTRTWERVFRRAGLLLSYSKGFNPRPRFQIAAALPVGVVGRAELLDVWLDEPLGLQDVVKRLSVAVPRGLEVATAEEVDLREPALQSLLRAASYRAELDSRETAQALRVRVADLMSAVTLPRHRLHKGRDQVYDLRPLIQAMGVESAPDGATHLVMRLQASPGGAGRPDEVVDALGLSRACTSIERTNLHFEFDK